MYTKIIEKTFQFQIYFKNVVIYLILTKDFLINSKKVLKC